MVPRKAREFYTRHRTYAPVAFFLSGLLFDIIALDRIDSAFVLIQHAIYLTIVAIILTLEVINEENPLQFRSNFLKKFWRYQDEITHFLLGALLSAFTVFYFKSASLINSFLFFGFIIFLLVANEWPRFRRLGISIRFTLLSVCTCSYFCYVVPIFWGRVGFWPFVTGLFVSAIFIGSIYYILKKFTKSESLALKVAAPCEAVFIVYFLLYQFHLVPPVPMSIKHFGIYHNVEKKLAGYELTHEKPWWNFWNVGDQSFKARSGDRVFCFFSIFSPTGFKDQVNVRWLFKDPKLGWRSHDAIPVQIAGGRDQGYRGFTYKRNYQPGDWRAQIETIDGREIGRIYFTVEGDSRTAERSFIKELMR